MRIRHNFVEEGAHAVIAFKITVDVAAGLPASNAEITRQPKVAEPVDNAEIDRLGTAPLLRRHRVQRHAEHLRCRACMDVLPLTERIDQRRIARHVREDAQLDLRVVR